MRLLSVSIDGERKQSGSSCKNMGNQIKSPRGSETSEKSKSLKVCYWNIHGWSSKIIGNKLEDSDFLEKIANCDIVALSELHSDKELSLPGFIRIKQKIRKKLHKGPKIAGGLCIFVKEDCEHLVQLLPSENQDSIWVRIKKEKCNEPEDIYIGSFYVSPEGKKGASSSDFFTSMNKELNRFKSKGVILVQGDLNARTGSEIDFVNYDKSDDSLGIENLDDHCQRNSEDSKINQRGKELLDLCKVNDLLIANGRKVGDLFGNFTSHQYNGSALNDYLLAPTYFLDKISHFSVGDYTPWLSDHCPIYSTINFNTLTKNNALDEKPKEVEPNYIFDATAVQAFCDGLKSEENFQKLQELLQNNCLSALNIGASLKSLLMENARKCKIRQTKNKSDKNISEP